MALVMLGLGADVDEGKIWENIPGPHGSTGADEALNRKFCESASGRRDLK